MSVLKPPSEDTSGGGKRGKKGGKKPQGKGKSDCFKILEMVMKKKLDPVIVFQFSKRECEANALQMSKLDFNTEDERAQVALVFSNAIDSLSEDDRKLPQVEHILPLLKRGIGIHHGGLLPILKEVIEILFQEGLVKALFATETFAMGLNMPARCVVFTKTRKFDGTDFRHVTSGEYIQMSGRAGRRGLDDLGLVIMMLDEKMEPPAAKSLLKGDADRLVSAFHLSYNMILNLLRVEGVGPAYLINRSFAHFQNNRCIPDLRAKLEDVEHKADACVVEREQEIGDYYQVRQSLRVVEDAVRVRMFEPDTVLSFLVPGRLVQVRDGDTEWGWGVVVKFHKKNPQGRKGQKQSKHTETVVVVDVALMCAPGEGEQRPPTPEEGTGACKVMPVQLACLTQLSSIRLYMPNDIRGADARVTLSRMLSETAVRFKDKGGLPLIDPVEDMKIMDPAFQHNLDKMAKLEARLVASPMHTHEDRDALYAAYEAKQTLVDDVKNIKRSIKTAKSVMHLDELKYRKRVLRRLGYTTGADVIEVKGRVACEISTGDELLLTELMFNGIFNDLSVEQTVALLSCFVYQEKSDSTPKLKEELAGPLRQMQESARRIARVCKESKLEIDEEEYVQSFRSEMMDVVFAWCNGSKFSDICKLTTIFEGSIIRGMRRLEELLRQMAAASKSIGNTELEAKFAAGITKIKRDIVFAASLYL